MPDLPPIALLPGLLCTRELWRNQIAFLEAEFEAEVFVPDFSSFDSVEKMASSVLGKVKEPFICCGLSMGGYATFEVWRQAKTGQVLGLGFFDTSARADTTDQLRRRQLLINMAKVGKFKGVSDKLLPLLIHQNRLDDKDLTDRIQRMAQDIGREGFFNQQQAIMDRPSSLADLGAIDIPTLTLCGRQDTLTPLHLSEEITKGIGERAELHIIEDCGHLSTMEAPNKVNQIFGRWLSKNFS